MKKKKMLFKIKPIFAALALATGSISVFAVPYAPGKIIHPIQYGPKSLINTALTPHQVRVAYGFKNIYEGGALGQGQTIAIIDAFDNPNIASDLNAFNKRFGLRKCTIQNGLFQVIFAAGRRPGQDPSGGWAGETALDVEWAHAMAPEAKIMLVEAASDNPADLYQAIEVAVAKGANVVSMSWGAPEYPAQTDFDQIFQKYPNVTFVASSGDSGAGTMHPASSPFVLGVGGTTLSVDDFGNYQGETAWAGSSGGVSTVETWPSYQSSLPIPSSNDMRGVPDVSYNADPQSGFSVYNTVPGPGGTGWQVVGGTSAGAPQWAALVAVLNSATKKVAGSNLSAQLYAAANPSTGKYNYLYRDVVSGSNGSCDYYCQAQPGYDYVTGLGSPEVYSLITDLVSSSKANPKA